MFVSLYTTHDSKIRLKSKQTKRKSWKGITVCSRRRWRRARNAQIQIYLWATWNNTGAGCNPNTTLCCTVKQLIKIGWWQIKSVIQIHSKPFLTELQKSHSLSFFDPPLPSVFLPLPACFPMVVYTPLPTLASSLHISSCSIIAKSIWNCRWEQLTKNGFVHILKTTTVIKTQRFSTKKWLNIHLSGHWYPLRHPQLGKLLSWNDIRAAHLLYCSFALALCILQKSIPCLSGTGICATHSITKFCPYRQQARVTSMYKCTTITITIPQNHPQNSCAQRDIALSPFDESSRGHGTMWQCCFHLLEWDNVTSAKAFWTSKSTFISMTLNSLPIKDKSPFHTRSSICQCHHTKERGNLFMPNMPPVQLLVAPLSTVFN